MALAKLRLPKDQKCGLSDLCQLFKIANEDHHRAMNDAEACYQVLRQLHIQQPITELVTSTAKAKNVGQGSLFPLAA
jgi:DNA polymerase III epsilon subunit-like protein